MTRPLSWFGIFRLGLVQAAMGAVVVLTTSTLNRVMVVELALPALLPGILVGLHYAVQVLRPRFGYGSDVGGRRTPWIVGGMGILAGGAVLAAVATAWMETSTAAGVSLAVVAFLLIGIGIGASGTSLLVLLAALVEPKRRAAAATVTWFMMIVGFIVSTAVAGQLLDPFTMERLISVTTWISLGAFVVTWLSVISLEARATPSQGAAGTVAADTAPRFRAACRQVWNEPHARRFTTFLFVAMLAFSAQDLVLEPFAGAVFGLTPGESTKLASLQNGGILVGMVLVAIAGSTRSRLSSLRAWRIGGCLASAAALLALAAASLVGPGWPLKQSVFMLGVTNGAFAVAAIGSMMALVGAGRENREGLRMGLWGTAQAFAFGLAGVLGTLSVDFARLAFGSAAPAYCAVFAIQASLFIVAARLAAQVDRMEARPLRRPASEPLTATGGGK